MTTRSPREIAESLQMTAHQTGVCICGQRATHVGFRNGNPVFKIYHLDDCPVVLAQLFLVEDEDD